MSPSPAFVEFYETYEGPLWSPAVGLELFDLCNESDRSILAATMACREYHAFPMRFLWLTDLSANAGIVLDTESDRVYAVDFEGGTEELLADEMEARWPSFETFLEFYFQGLG